MNASQLRRISQDQLESILADHLTAVQSLWKEGKRADLSGVDLKGYDLRGRQLLLADLRGANLSAANLTNSNTTLADVARADLRGAILPIEQLTSMQNWIFALLDEKTLTALRLPPNHNELAAKKNFAEYNLRGRYLGNCNLAGANFKEANLREAKFGQNDLREADLAGADIYHAFLEEAKVSTDQAFAAKNWIHARWSPKVLADLGLPRNHNEFLTDQGQNFTGHYDLHNRDLKGSDFSETIIEGLDVTGSDFSAAIIPPDKALSTKNWLLARWSPDVLQAIRLPKDHNDRIAIRNFENYDLEGRVLSGFDLSKANLRGASLNYATFAYTDLHDAVLANAVLHNVDLTTARGLRAYQLLGTDLTGATLPPAITESLKSPPGVDESSKNSRKLFVTMLASCLYCWLTILSTTDAAILLGSTSLGLPIIQTSIPVVAFFLAAPFLILVLYVYLHFSLQNLWESLATLPAIFPDGRPLHERAYPWFMNSLVRTRFPILKKERALLPPIQVFCALLLAWWVVPITLVAFWLRFLVRHNWGFIVLHVILVSLAVWLACWFWGVANDTLDGRTRVQSERYKTLSQRRAPRATLAGLVVSLLALVASVNAFSGKRDPYAPEARSLIRSLLDRIGWSPFAHLRGARLSPEPPNWPAEDWHEVKGGQFSRVVLRQVDATGTFAVNADFTNADLRNSVFDFADLRGANFLGAKLDGVSFYGADLREAFFPDVAPAEMDLGQANVQGAHFGKLGPKTLKPAHNWILADISDPARFSLPSDHGERLSRRDFSGYDLNQLLTNGPARYLKNGGENVLVLPDVDNLSAADLSGANLQQVNLEDIALRKTNLLGADLRGANVKGCDFYQAILHDADLRGLDMTGVHGLTLAQIQSAKTDKKTRLPDYLQRQLAFGQTKSPNEAVSGSDNRSGGGATREQPR